MKINVLYQSDDNYALVGLTSIVSLVENNRHYENINIFYVSDEISIHNKKIMQDTIDGYDNVKLFFIDADVYIKKLRALNVSSWHNRIVTWCKLLVLQDIDIDEKKLLYINPHTIINGKLDFLFEKDLGNNVMACVSDLSVREKNILIGHAVSDDYFNCGLMLINHDIWKKERLSQYCELKLQEKSDYLVVDQDFCNDVFFGRIQKLPFDTFVFDTVYIIKALPLFLKIMGLKEENYYNFSEIKHGLQSPKIIYSTFRGTGNPWELGNKTPCEFLWDKFMSQIEFKKQPNSRSFFKKILYSHFATTILVIRRVYERFKYNQMIRQKY